MPTLAHVAPFVLLLPLLSAQDPAAGLTLGHTVAITNAAGLQASPDDDGLRGSGPDYAAHFTDRGVRYEAALGTAVETVQHLTLAPTSVRRGARDVVGLPSAARPTQRGDSVVYPHAPGIDERHAVAPHGLELSWRFAQRPAGSGDLVVRYAVDSNLPAPVARADGLHFERPGIGGVHVGTVTGVDANGATAAGGLRFVDGALELSLPGAFVDEAAYPLVLDPAIGTTILVDSGAAGSEPDVAYADTDYYYVVVWTRRFAANAAYVRAQRMNLDGLLIGGTIAVTSSGDATRPRAACLFLAHRCGIVWTQGDSFSATTSVRFAAIETTFGAVTHGAVLASGPVGNLLDPDIGCDSRNVFDQDFVVAWHEQAPSAVRSRRVSFDSAGVMSLAPTANVLTGAIPGRTYAEPELARTAGLDHKLLLVARYATSGTAETGIEAVVLATDGAAPGPGIVLATSTTATLSAPDVDGHAGRWMVAWQDDTGRIHTRPVALDPASPGTLQVGTVATWGGTTLASLSAPTVGYTRGRTWIGHRSDASQLGTQSLRAMGIDSHTCESCNDVFTRTILGADRHLVVTTTAASSFAARDEGLAVWREGNAVFGQRLRNYAPTGTWTDLGGACGNGGAQLFSHGAAIGSAAWECTVLGLPPQGLVTAFNFNAPGPGIACGTCVWVPFGGVTLLPVYGNSAAVELPIPCEQALVGSAFETQWTTLDNTQAPCPLLPGFVVTERVLHTIGS